MCLHGAGLSGLTFAALAKQCKSNANVVSFDFRNHGENKQEDGENMCIDNLIADTILVIKWLTTEKYPESSIVLVGHSMGGGVAVKVMHQAKTKSAQEDWAKHMMGMIIIDVVEGTAVKSFPGMEHFLATRPPKFPSLQFVIYHALTQGSLRGSTSARVSMPGQVYEKMDTVINQPYFTWRTDLPKTRDHWLGWFKGMTREFLQSKMPKMLILATNNRLDNEMSQADVEGKLKKVIVDDVGHNIMEDNPHRVSQLLTEFIHSFHIPAKYNETFKITSMGGKEVEIHN